VRKYQYEYFQGSSEVITVQYCIITSNANYNQKHHSNTAMRNHVTDNDENTIYISSNTPSMITTGPAGIAQSFAVTT